jgi:inorganic pyrophosphatase/exopolyphosphatase
MAPPNQEDKSIGGDSSNNKRPASPAGSKASGVSSLGSPKQRPRLRSGSSVGSLGYTDHHGGGAEALRLAGADGKTKQYNDGVLRQRTQVEVDVLAREKAAHTLADALPKEISTIPTVDLFIPEALKDAVFVGHLVTDLDSVGGAIGAAALYNGKAALASEINSETAFALEEWGVQKPPTIEEVLKENPNAKICLVDHQQTSQMNPSINPDNVVGVIDHHALQSKTIVTDRPIYIDIRPWGSMSTINSHTFLTHSRRPPVHVAGMLLCAILSDTLNLQGPTTTEWDRLMVAVLSEIAGVDDIQLLASQQFKAKSKELAGLSAHGLVNGDQKCFSFTTETFTGDVGFAVVETTDDAVIIDRLDELLPEIVATKKEKNMSALFLAVVNIVQLKGTLLLCGPSELSLAKAAFPDCTVNDTHTMMDLGSRVSRKKDYIPEITKAIKAGWKKPVKRGASVVDMAGLGKLEVDPTNYQHITRRGSQLEIKGGQHFTVDDDDDPIVDDEAPAI